MKLRDTIKRAVHCFPRLNGSRAAVLNHLFCTIGNGFRWQGGELVDERTYEEPCPEPRHSLMEQWAIDEGEDVAEQKRLEYVAKRRAETERVHAVEDQIVNGKTSLWLRDTHTFDYFSPLSDYSALFVPDDVKHDWLAGAIETALLIVALNEREPTDERRRNAKLARAALDRLHDLVGERASAVRFDAEAILAYDAGRDDPCSALVRACLHQIGDKPHRAPLYIQDAIDHTVSLVHAAERESRRAGEAQRKVLRLLARKSDLPEGFEIRKDADGRLSLRALGREVKDARGVDARLALVSLAKRMHAQALAAIGDM